MAAKKPRTTKSLKRKVVLKPVKTLKTLGKSGAEGWIEV